MILGLLYSFQERLVRCIHFFHLYMLASSTYILIIDFLFFAGMQIYIPKIPGIPNDFQYYPNDYGLEYEVSICKIMHQYSYLCYMNRPKSQHPLQ